MNAKPRVFVTDGSYPNGLAAVRALSQAGFRVTAGERKGVRGPENLSFWSRHCAARFSYPDPRRDPPAAIRALSEHFRETRYDAAIPVGLDMAELFAEHRAELPVKALLPPLEAFRTAADKRRTFAHAQRAGIPVPRTLDAEHWRDLEPPFAFKHRRSGARIVRNASEAASIARALEPSIDDFLAQAYVPGQNGFGYFGFFVSGRERAYFMHERLVQFPKEGGPSVVARAIHDERLHALGRTLLESLNWNGVAMVEFKRSTDDGELYLMEINPKLWGSLDLAIKAGCNFPVWVARSLIYGENPPDCSYAAGLTYQWIVPNGLKSFIKYPEFRPRFLRNLLRGVKTDVTLSDPLPTAAGLLAMATHTVKATTP